MDNCKVCGTEMIDYEGYNSEYYMNEHKEWVRAYCPHCNKVYRWVEVYSLSRIEDFEEDI